MQKLNLSKSKPDKTKLVRNLAQGNVLVPFLDRAFQDFDEPFEFKYEPKKGDDAWHPSGDCLPLASALYAQARGEGERDRISGALRKTFMVGHYWHQLLQYIVAEKLGYASWDDIEREGKDGWGPYKGDGNDLPTWWEPYHWIHGSADICPLVTKKWTGIVDFKTMSAQQFKSPTLPEWCADKYLCQMQIYMHLFDQERALIVAVNKDSPHDFREYEFTRDQDLIDNIVEKWKFVGECLDAGIAPTDEDDEAFLLPFQPSLFVGG